MKILGIETSCDETAVCLIEAKGGFGADFECRVLGNALLSQIEVHAPYGGVFPNLAKREHAKNLVPLLEKVLGISEGTTSFDAGQLQCILEREPELFERLTLFLRNNGKPHLDCIAVTNGPGLEPALWVGVNFAKALSEVWGIPIVGVNHLEGHIAMATVEERTGQWHMRAFELPLIALLISGGHTQIDLVERWPKFTTIGETRDDAVGEAFDKVARMLGLPYPGGPEISRLAEEVRSSDSHLSISDFQFSKLPRPMINENNFDFSFSGLKTAVLRQVKDKTLSDDERAVIAKEFEDACADVIVAKTARAVEEYGAQTVLMGGGVCANTHIKKRLLGALSQTGVALLYPEAQWATDNALMIALAGYFRALNKEFTRPAAVRANGNLRLGV